MLSCKSKSEEPSSQKSSEEINVLFIGNSLTYYNDMPQMLQKMLDETNPEYNIEQATYPGMSLDGHLDKIITSGTGDNVNVRPKTPEETTETEKKIREKDWDIITLQTGGVSVLIPESVKYNVDPAIKKIKEMATGKPRFILFNTWTTNVEFPKKYCYRGIQMDPSLEQMDEFCSAVIENKEDFLLKLNSSYSSIAETHGLEKTNHGDIFQKVFDEHPELEILEDEMHPSKLGAFLSACIFYELITKKDATGLEYNAGLDQEESETLKELAMNNIYENL